MVTVRQKKKGKGNPWHIFIHSRGIIRSRVVGDRKDAEKVASELRRKMALGEFKIDQGEGVEQKQAPEFSAYVEHYMAAHATPLLKRNTVTSYRMIFKYLVPLWAGKRIDEIQRKDVKQLLLQRQAEGSAAGSVRNLKALISGLFSFACEEELIAANPALKLGKFIRKTDTRTHAYFCSREQVDAVLCATREHFPEHYAFLLLLFRTGLRLGEALGLAVEDVNFAGSYIDVSRSYSHGNWDSPKSHKSRRVDLSDQLKMALQVHIQNVTKQFGGELPSFDLPTGLKGGKTIHLLFPDDRGGGSDGSNFRRRVFKVVLEKANVRCRIHDARHTYASMLLGAGAPVHYVKEQMGHASIQTTVDTYGHCMPNANRNAVNCLDDLGSSALKITPALAG